MKFRYSKILIASSLAAAIFALTHCSPNTPSLSKELLLHDRAMSGVDPVPPEQQNINSGSNAESLAAAPTEWLDEGAYENHLDRIPQNERIVTLSEENRDDAVKLNGFINSGKLIVNLPDASPQQLSVILKLDVTTAAQEEQINLLSSSPAGQVPVLISSQGSQSVVTLDLSNIRNESGIMPSLSKLEALTLIYSTTPASQ